MCVCVLCAWGGEGGSGQVRVSYLHAAGDAEAELPARALAPGVGRPAASHQHPVRLPERRRHHIQRVRPFKNRRPQRVLPNKPPARGRNGGRERGGAEVGSKNEKSQWVRTFTIFFSTFISLSLSLSFFSSFYGFSCSSPGCLSSLAEKDEGRRFEFARFSPARVRCLPGTRPR